MDPYLNIFEEPVRYKRMHRRAGYSTTAVVVGLAFFVILLLVWWQVSNPTDTVMVDDDPTLLRDQETRDVPRDTTPSTVESDMVTEAEVVAARARARAELNAIQLQLEADQDYEAALLSIQELESELDRTYAQTAMETRSGWEELKADFDVLQTQLRAGSADSLGLLGGLIQDLGDEIRVDE